MRPTTVRLSPSYDAERMTRDVATLADLARARPGPFPTSGWEGIALVQADGRADNTRSPMPSRSGPQPTPALASCPYLAEILASLPGPILGARLLYLEPGGVAPLHRDPIGFPVGVVRLHVPIVTHPDVEMWLGGERTRWAEGELWFGDFAFPHRLANPSSITRIHLVLDVCASDALLALFPPAIVERVVSGGLCKFEPVKPLADADLRRFARHLTFPPHSLPGVMMHDELDAVVEVGAVVARAGDQVALVLDPIDVSRLSIRGYYPGVTFEALPDGGLELVHRGRVRMPEGSSVDDEDAPWELFTSRAPVA